MKKTASCIEVRLANWWSTYQHQTQLKRPERTHHDQASSYKELCKGIATEFKQGRHALYEFSSNRAAMLYMCSHQTGQPCSICVLMKQGSHALYVFSSNRAAMLYMCSHQTGQPCSICVLIKQGSHALYQACTQGGFRWVHLNPPLN